jgi:carbon-monoxide dehydrogenase large subunit
MNAPDRAGLGNAFEAAATGTLSGAPVERVEDERFLTGAGRFTDDVRFEGMGHAAILRSTHAHARIRHIDCTAARALPGVMLVATAADIAQAHKPIPIRLAPLPGLDRFLQPTIAADEVRYVGEPVAIVVASSRYVAEDALDLIEVDYDERPAVASITQSASDATLVHAAVGTNVATQYPVGRGDVDRAFADAPYTRRERFRCHRHTGAPMETRGLVAEWNGSLMRVWGATKVPFFNRGLLASFFDLPETAVDMIETDIGGGFGIRGEFYPEDFLVPWASMQLGRPVKWIEDRREHLMAANHARETECELEIAMNLDGTIRGLRGRVMADLGAYVRTGGGVAVSRLAQYLPGPYRISDFGCEVMALVTNKTPVGTMRGPGRYEANYFRERLLDLACGDLGLDPVAVREMNLIAKHEMPWPIGRLVPTEGEGAYDVGDFHSGLHKALSAIGYDRLPRDGALIDGWLHGVGVACFVESSGGGKSENARIVARTDGSFDIYSGVSTMGQGHETVFAQIAGDELGAPISAFRVHHGSTAHVDYGWGTFHSRAIVVGGSAVKLAAAQLREQLDALAAAGHRGAPAEDIEVKLRYDTKGPTYSYGTHVAHVAVDPETARVKVLAYVALEDVGRVMNPLLAHGQAVGGAVQGIGATFLDELRYDENAQLLSGSYADYLMATSTEAPAVQAVLLEESPSPSNPLGAKGAGEGGIVATAGALANAVGNALAAWRLPLTSLPLSLDNLARALREARAAGVVPGQGH